MTSLKNHSLNPVAGNLVTHGFTSSRVDQWKMPGEGWLQFEANARDDGRTDLVQTAYFASKGISGILYWYSLYPVHRLIFSRMIEAIAQKASEYSRTSLHAG
jgi:hypothetical protein